MVRIEQLVSVINRSAADTLQELMLCELTHRAHALVKYLQQSCVYVREKLRVRGGEQ